MSSHIKTFFTHHCIEVLLFLFWLFVYGLTTSHSVVEGDTGEFLASAAIHGVSHDPGFPLYSIITRLVFLLPFGHNAWAINFTSAIFATCALIVTFRLVKLITENIPAALFSVFALGTYENFWFYATVAQVHALQVLLLSLFSYFLVLFVKTKKRNYLYFCSLIIGLGISHNYTIVFVVPSLLIALFFQKKHFSLSSFSKAFLFFLFGLLPYLYIIWAASTNPPINWGRIHDIGSFLFIFFRGDYGLFKLGPQSTSTTLFYSSFIDYFQSSIITSWYILPFAILSFWLLYKKNFIYSLLFCSYFLMGPFFYLLMNQQIISITFKANIEQYLSYSFLYLSIFAGIGLGLLIKRYKNTLKDKLVIILICMYFITPFFIAFNDIKLEANGPVAPTIRLMLSEIPQNGILITTGDDFYFPSLYWQYMKNYRPDITVVNVNLSAPWYMENLQIQHPKLLFLFANPSNFYRNACKDIAPQGKLFIYPWVSAFDEAFTGNCTIIPYGLVDKVVPQKKITEAKQVKQFTDSQWNSYTGQVALSQYKNTSARTREFLLSLADQLTFTGIYYQQIGKTDWALETFNRANEISPDEVSSLISESQISYNKKDFEKAIALLNEGVRRAPATAILYKNLGIFYLKESDSRDAYRNFEQYLTFNPEDTDVGAIQNFINSYQMQGR